MHITSIIALFLVSLALLANFAVIILAVKKLIRSDLALYQKIVWVFVIASMQFLGSVIFIIYHDNYLVRGFR